MSYSAECIDGRACSQCHYEDCECTHHLEWLNDEERDEQAWSDFYQDREFDNRREEERL